MYLEKRKPFVFSGGFLFCYMERKYILREYMKWTRMINVFRIEDGSASEKGSARCS